MNFSLSGDDFIDLMGVSHFTACRTRVLYQTDRNRGAMQSVKGSICEGQANLEVMVQPAPDPSYACEHATRKIPVLHFTCNVSMAICPFAFDHDKPLWCVKIDVLSVDLVQ